MSLTREQWLDMFVSVKYIEAFTKNLPVNDSKINPILKETSNIKKLIQSVIGQQK